MTVKELIKYLETLPQDYIVLTDGVTNEILQKEQIDVDEYYKEVTIYS